MTASGLLISWPCRRRTRPCVSQFPASAGGRRSASRLLGRRHRVAWIASLSCRRNVPACEPVRTKRRFSPEAAISSASLACDDRCQRGLHATGKSFLLAKARHIGESVRWPRSAVPRARARSALLGTARRPQTQPRPARARVAAATNRHRSRSPARWSQLTGKSQACRERGQRAGEAQRAASRLIDGQGIAGPPRCRRRQHHVPTGEAPSGCGRRINRRHAEPAKGRQQAAHAGTRPHRNRSVLRAFRAVRPEIPRPDKSSERRGPNP